jgi:hypothetical protein
MEKDGLKAPLDIRANWVKGSKKARRGACSGRAWAVEHNEATPQNANLETCPRQLLSPSEPFFPPSRPIDCFSHRNQLKPGPPSLGLVPTCPCSTQPPNFSVVLSISVYHQASRQLGQNSLARRMAGECTTCQGYLPRLLLQSVLWYKMIVKQPARGIERMPEQGEKQDNIFSASGFG